MGRSTQGVIVMRLREGELVSSLAPVVESGDDVADDGRTSRRSVQSRARGRADPQPAPSVCANPHPFG